MDREAWHVAVHGLQRVGHDWVSELNWLNEWKDYSNYLGEGAESSRKWATAHFLVFDGRLGTFTVPVGVSFSLLMCYNEL